MALPKIIIQMKLAKRGQVGNDIGKEGETVLVQIKNLKLDQLAELCWQVGQLVAI